MASRPKFLYQEILCAPGTDAVLLGKETMSSGNLIHRWAPIALASVGLVAWCFALAAEDNAQLRPMDVTALKHAGIMPYADVYPLLSKLAVIDGHDKIRVRFRLSSKRAEVKPKDIQVSLQGNTLYREIPVAADGEIEIPLLPQALPDEAQLVSNQPEHSLNVDVTLEAILPDPRSFRYADARAVLAPAHDVVRAFLPRWLGWLAPDFNALLVRFEHADGQTVTVRLKGGDQVYRVDAEGNVKLPIDEDLLREDPWISVSQTPQLITVTRERTRELRLLN